MSLEKKATQQYTANYMCIRKTYRHQKNIFLIYAYVIDSLNTNNCKYSEKETLHEKAIMGIRTSLFVLVLFFLFLF